MRRFIVLRGLLILVVLSINFFTGHAYGQSKCERFRKLYERALKMTVTESTEDEYYECLKEAEKLSSGCGESRIMGEFYILLAEEVSFRGEDADAYYRKAIDIARRVSDIKLLSRVYSAYGHKEMEIRSGKSINLYAESLRYAYKSQDDFYIAASLIENGILNSIFRRKTRAKEFYLKAIIYAQKVKFGSNDSFNEFTSQNILPYSYMYLSLNTDDEEKALQFILKAFELLPKIENKSDENQQLIKTITLSYSVLNYKHGNFSQAIAGALKLKQLATTQQDEFYLNGSYIILANSYAKQKKYALAYPYVKLIESTSGDAQTDGLKAKMANTNRLFANVYASKGEYRKAHQFLLKEIVNMDSLYKSKQDEIFENYAAKYQTVEKQRKIVQQNLLIQQQQNHRNLLLGAALFVIVGVIFFYQRHVARQKAKQIVLDMELKKERELNDFRTTFLQNLSHELRTPLTLLEGNLSLAAGAESIERKNFYISKARYSSQMILSNAKDLLSLLYTDVDEEEDVLIDYGHSIEMIASAFGPASALKGMKITCNGAKNQVSGIVRLSYFEKIISNLVSNAVKFGKRDSEIIIEMATRDNFLHITVCNEGKAINENDHQKIFERFYRSDNFDKERGFGLGLSISKELALKLGGTLNFVPAQRGKTIFELALPISGNTSITEYTPDTKTVAEDLYNFSHLRKSLASGKRYDILIVEDNIDLREYYTNILSQWFNCTFSVNSIEALQSAQLKVFDLIISDVMMPGPDGMQFRKLVREIPGYDTVPFVFVSARTTDKDHLEAFRLGVDDYIDKPFQKEQLIARIFSLLNNLIIRRENYDIGRKASVIETVTLDLLDHVKQIVTENIADENLSAAAIADRMKVSQRKLSSDIKTLTGMSLIQFVMEIRLMEAYKMLQDKKYRSVKEVCFEVGIGSDSYFNKVFKKRFGINPGDIIV